MKFKIFSLINLFIECNNFFIRLEFIKINKRDAMSFIFYFLAMAIILFGMILAANTAGLQPILFYDFVSLIFVFGPTIFIALASFRVSDVFRSLGLAFVVDTKDKSILIKTVDCLNEIYKYCFWIYWNNHCSNCRIIFQY